MIVAEYGNGERESHLNEGSYTERAQPKQREDIGGSPRRGQEDGGVTFQEDVALTRGVFGRIGGLDDSKAKKAILAPKAEPGVAKGQGANPQPLESQISKRAGEIDATGRVDL